MAALPTTTPTSMMSTIDSAATTLISTVNSTLNDSLSDPQDDISNDTLTLITQVCNVAILVLLMLSMGVNIGLKDIRETFRHPIGFFIGMASQFVLMPLIGFCLSVALRLESAGALSVLVLACCPGGTLSNLFTFWTGGDICLSVSMTTVSTAVAIGMMPLNLFIYTRVWTDETSVIPYVNIVTTLVSILIPVVFGVFLRWWKKKWTKWVTRIGLVFTLIFVVAAFIISILLNPAIFNASWGLWVCAAILPLVGYTIGYVFAFILRQPHYKCRTIAFETGSQNVSLALTLTVLTFNNSPLFLDMLFYPSLYAFFIYIDSFAVVGLYRLVVYLRKDKGSDQGKDNDGDVVKVVVNGIGNDGDEKENRHAEGDYSQEVETEMETL